MHDEMHSGMNWGKVWTRIITLGQWEDLAMGHVQWGLEHAIHISSCLECLEILFSALLSSLSLLVFGENLASFDPSRLGFCSGLLILDDVALQAV